MLFFFNDTATTEIYTLSLHDALPIWYAAQDEVARFIRENSQPDDTIYVAFDQAAIYYLSDRKPAYRHLYDQELRADRKSTRLNSSHANISYAVFCLKKKTISITLVTV